MDTNFRHPTAKIYTVPARGQATIGARHEDPQPVADLRSHRLPTVEFGSGWYHDAAVRDAERTRKP